MLSLEEMKQKYNEICNLYRTPYDLCVKCLEYFPTNRNRDIIKYFIDVINVKCSTDDIGFLRDIPGILPAYHMNKSNWISVVLDGTVPQKNIKQLIKASFDLTVK